MEKIEVNKNEEEKTFPATVVKVIDEYKVVINRGALHNIKPGQRFLIYRLEDEEIKDPVTGESLGYLEIVKGTGKVTHIQERMSTIETDRREILEKRIIRRKPSALFFSGQEEEIITPSGDIMPFENPKVGDKAKPI